LLPERLVEQAKARAAAKAVAETAEALDIREWAERVIIRHGGGAAALLGGVSADFVSRMVAKWSYVGMNLCNVFAPVRPTTLA
jgi:hypothetical protein